MIYVGTCGFAYKDWIGPFYPPATKQPEMLRYYAQRFRAVEIDSSYYGVPTEETVRRMDARTPEAFRFCFKVPATLTHAPEATTSVHPDARTFRSHLEPLLRAGKLGCALAQFPNAFRPSAASERRVRAIADALTGLPLVVEFRHRDWQIPYTYAMLHQIGIGWCNLDMPRLEQLPLPSSDATSAVGYVRFHGRNAGQWWQGTNVTRYAYDYAPEELIAWTERVAEIDQSAQDTYVFFNNHACGKAAGNAESFERLLEERYGEASAATIARPPAPPPVQPGFPGLEWQ